MSVSRVLYLHKGHVAKGYESLIKERVLLGLRLLVSANKRVWLCDYDTHVFQALLKFALLPSRGAQGPSP